MGWPSREGLGCVDEGRLAAFADGHIDPGEREPIEVHLADCSDCRTVFAHIAGTLRSHVEASSSPSNDRDQEQLGAGTRVGRYVVERLIGRGSMGTVYAANDPDLERTVALKLLRAEALSASARLQMRSRLLREAQAMARLSHPEVITVYDVGTFGDQLFVAMEYIEGATLRGWLAERHRSCDEIVEVYERAGSGLAAAHESGLVHRDFKPDNVLVGRDGRVRVTDFGLARSVGSASALTRAAAGAETSSETGLAMTLTRSGTLLGTPAYMAPEQLRGGTADARSDVFSFCVAFYEALYGERPFAGSTVPAVRSAIDEGRMRAPPVMTRVPGWLRNFLLRGLRAAPERRPESMRALLDGLRASRALYRKTLRRWVGLALLVLLASLAAYASTARGHSSSIPGERRVANVAPALSTARPAEIGAAPFPAPAPIPPKDAIQDHGPAQPSMAVAEIVHHRSPAVTKHTPPRTAPSTSAPPAASASPAASSAAPLVGHNGALILE